MANDLGTTFASQVAVAISAAAVHERTHALVLDLEDALLTRDVIGQAKGIIMATRHVTSDDPFAVLRDASQHTNRKLHDIADDVVATGVVPEA